jgi:hypothetical protein
MKKEWPQYRGTTLLAPQFVRPGADDQLNLGGALSESERRVRTKKIFIVRKTTRLPSTNAAGKKIRRILIFDNHPESLRLVFGHRQHRNVDLSRPAQIISWELILVSILAVAGLVGMFWQLLRIFVP